MATLQLRLRDQEMLWNVVREIVEDVWAAMEEYRNTDTVDPMDFACIHRVVLDHLTKNVTGFTACGERDRCHANLSPVVPKGVEATRAQIEHSRQNECYVLLFESKTQFDLYVRDLDEQIFSLISPADVMRYWISLKPRLEQILRYRLGEHLYENPACENCPRCIARKQFDPWMKTDAA